jgi:hypothetical protein
VQDLLDRVLNFRSSSEGVAFSKFVNSIRADGIEGRRAENLSLEERKTAHELLAPYSKLDPEKSRSLEVKYVGIPGVEVSSKIGVPAWLKIWWNDNVPFGGLRKTLRRMWMAADSYNNFSSELRKIWSNS